MAEQQAQSEWWKIACFTVPAIILLCSLSGWLSNSGYGNAWFDSLIKPAFMPPGWVFGVVWPVLYALLGFALALILAEPPTGPDGCTHVEPPTVLSPCAPAYRPSPFVMICSPVIHNCAAPST